MRIFYSVDVHGAETVWRKWISAIGIYECDCLMLCGDLAGKALVPIIDYGKGYSKSGYFGREVKLKTEEEIVDWETKLANGGVYLGWRLFRGDFPELAFNVYRAVENGSGVRLNETPLEKTSDFSDGLAPADKDKTYWVEPLLYKMPQGTSKKVTVKAGAPALPYISMKLNDDYAAQKVGCADLDGDGAYDFVIKQPDANVDPNEKYWKPSPGTYKLEAYLQDGTFLWRKDLGWSIEQGIWYSPYLVYDFDGDGKADAAIFRPAGSTWYVRRSSDSQISITQFGAAGDRPVAADYDGDGKSDCAVFDQNTGNWYVIKVNDTMPMAWAFPWGW